MANVACFSPRACGVAWHRPYSPAARACRARADVTPSLGARAPALPAGPTGAQVLKDVAAAVRADLAADDAATGWSPRSGRPHPHGGHTRRSMRVREPGPGRPRFDAVVVLTHLDADGAIHRGDGPAVVEYAEDGQVVLSEWVEHGARHRGDGPSRVRDGQATAYHWRGSTVAEDVGRPLPDVETALAAWVAAGAARQDVVGWLVCERLPGYRTGHPGRTDALVAAGLSPEEVIACWAAGVLDPVDIAAVAHGELPASWAATGA